jgi:hypothetical protein
MTDIADIIFPPDWPETGKANRPPQPNAPVTQAQPPAPQYQAPPLTGVGNYAAQPSTVAAVGRKSKVVPAQPPAIGTPNIQPRPAPLGVQPQFTTPTVNFPWVYGNGGYQ